VIITVCGRRQNTRRVVVAGGVVVKLCHWATIADVRWGGFVPACMLCIALHTCMYTQHGTTHSMTLPLHPAIPSCCLVAHRLHGAVTPP